MRWTVQTTWIGAGVLALALGLAACGSSGGSSSDTTAASSPAGTSAAGSTPSASAPSGSVTVDTNFTGKGSSDLCAYAKEIQNSGDIATGDISKANLDKLNDVFQKVEAKAPAEIKSDVQTFAKVFATLRAVYAKYNYDPAKLTSAASDPDVQNLEKMFTDPSFQAASARINAYFEQVCGIGGSS
jgi:hypothetical protein